MSKYNIRLKIAPFFFVVVIHSFSISFRFNCIHTFSVLVYCLFPEKNTSRACSYTYMKRSRARSYSRSSLISSRKGEKDEKRQKIKRRACLIIYTGRFIETPHRRAQNHLLYTAAIVFPPFVFLLICVSLCHSR